MSQSAPTSKRIRLYLIAGLVCAAGIGGAIIYQGTNARPQDTLPDTAAPHVSDTTVPPVPDQPTQSTQPVQESAGPDTKTIDISLLEQEIHKIANQDRESNGAVPIGYDDKLGTIARIHSQDMADHQYLSHNSYDGHDLNYRYAFAGYSCKAPEGSYRYSTSSENIAVVTAQGSEDDIAQHIVNTWLDNMADRNNILDSGHQVEGIGIALTENKMAVYATDDFC